MVPAQVITRVFQLMYGDGTGTCFAIDVDKRQYLCTAKHCLPDFTGSTIEIFRDNQWKQLAVDLIGYGSHDSDVCVLAPSVRLVGDHLTLNPTAGGLRYGQEVFFLGFPYRMHMDSKDLNRLFPFPFVKRATVSACDFHKSAESTVYLDGHNNPGFSGGPVVFTPDGRPNGEWRVAAIVSGYTTSLTPVVDSAGNQTSYGIQSNTGIVCSHNIKHAMDAIRDNPIGLSLT